jgi:hypothetical protein
LYCILYYYIDIFIHFIYYIEWDAPNPGIELNILGWGRSRGMASVATWHVGANKEVPDRNIGVPPGYVSARIIAPKRTLHAHLPI